MTPFLLGQILHISTETDWGSADTDVVQRLYQRPFRLGNGPAYVHGLARAIGSLGSASENFILGTKL